MRLQECAYTEELKYIILISKYLWFIVKRKMAQRHQYSHSRYIYYIMRSLLLGRTYRYPHKNSIACAIETINNEGTPYK